MNERFHVLFFGRVQGVGFRFTTRDIAGRFAVLGLVRNLPDGSVELIAEGETSELERFVQAVRDEMDRFITNHIITRSASRGDFVSFEIQR